MARKTFEYQNGAVRGKSGYYLIKKLNNLYSSLKICRVVKWHVTWISDWLQIASSSTFLWW